MSDKSHKAEKATNSTKEAKKTLKHWFTVFIFGAIIVVFALEFTPYGRGGGGDTGVGVAATVNDSAITVSEYKQREERIMQDARARLDQFPEAQREMLTKQLRRQALDQLIVNELQYQAATHKGVLAPDAEVRDTILGIPFLSENGRFEKDRYHVWLQNMNMTTDEFEQEVRKELVIRKVQELFVGSALPTREELRRNRELADQKVDIKFVEIKKDDMEKPGFIPDNEVADYLKAHKDEVEKYYKDNIVEFTQPEKIHARHILIRVDDKRKDAEAAKMAADLKKELTVKNFATMAAKHSDDPGSKAKGGDLGEFERGRMVPEFENAAFSLPVGKISDPVKTNYGYHLILVEGKTKAGQIPLEKAQTEIARKLYLRNKQSDVIAKIRGMVEKGDRKQVDGFVQKAGLKWNESGEFDLSSQMVPKLGEGQDVISALLRHGKTPGLIPQLISGQGRYFIVDLTSWKVAPDKTPTETEGLEQMMAYRKSSDLIQEWSKEVESKATIQKNQRIVQ